MYGTSWPQPNSPAATTVFRPEIFQHQKKLSQCFPLSPRFSYRRTVSPDAAGALFTVTSVAVIHQFVHYEVMTANIIIILTDSQTKSLNRHLLIKNTLQQARSNRT